MPKSTNSITFGLPWVCQWTQYRSRTDFKYAFLLHTTFTLHGYTRLIELFQYVLAELDRLLAYEDLRRQLLCADIEDRMVHKV